MTSTKPIAIKLNNKIFSSMTQACKFYKIDLSLIRYRISKGWTMEEAYKVKNKKYDKIVVNNQGFKNLNSACKKYKVNFNTANSRLHRGWSLEEALEIIDRKQNSKCKGLLYIITNTLNNYKYIGITSKKLNDRFTAHKYESKKGTKRKLYEAMRKYGEDKFKIKLIKESNNWHELRILEIKYIEKYKSIKYGYNVSKGGSGAANQCGTEITYKGIKFISIRSLADYLNINKSTLEWRIKNELPLDYSPRGKNRTGKALMYKGLYYKSVVELSKSLNISTPVVYYRLKRKLCPKTGINSATLATLIDMDKQLTIRDLKEECKQPRKRRSLNLGKPSQD